MTNLGTAGVGYINGDLTVALARLPLDEWIGVQADSHWAADGILVGAATWFDHVGAFGTGLVTAVSTPRRRSTSPTTRSLRGPFRRIVPPRPARVDLLLGIDMGTGSTKGVLVDARQPIGQIAGRRLGGRDHFDADDAPPFRLGEQSADAGTAGAKLSCDFGLCGVVGVVELGRRIKQRWREMPR